MFRAVAATKALKQISVIYEVISWDRLLKIIPFYQELELERFIVDIAKHRFVKVIIFMCRTLNFEKKAYILIHLYE